MSVVEQWLGQVDAAEERLRAQAELTGGETGPDPSTGEVWERGQVWGHLAEFIAFWVEQAGDVIDEYTGTPVAYGRLKDDPGRIAGVDSGLTVAIGTLWEEVRSDLVALRQFLQALPGGWEQAVGRHPKLGEVRVEQIIESTLISHLEEHAAQLEGI
jgi:hypothetical protein